MFVPVLLALCSFSSFSLVPQHQLNAQKAVIVNEWWTCSACGDSNPAGSVRCEVCGKHK